MKKIIKNIAFIALGFFLLFVSCQEKYITYEGAEYIMFSDTLATYPVQQDVEHFTIPIVSTVSKSYDRTIAVEVIDKGSNAIEGYHYNLVSNTITIKAGELRADLLVKPNYENIEIDDSLGFELRLVMDENLEMPGIGIGAKVVLKKVCPFVIEDFTGWSVFTSLFLYYYDMYGIYQKLVWTEKDEVLENTVILKNPYHEGYDIKITFNPKDPMDHYITMPEDQVIGREDTFFGIAYGDNQILTREGPSYYSKFDTGEKYVELYTLMYVMDLGEIYGYVGEFLNVIEWISDEEADRLDRVEGMPGYNQNLKK